MLKVFLLSKALRLYIWLSEVLLASCRGRHNTSNVGQNTTKLSSFKQSSLDSKVVLAALLEKES